MTADPISGSTARAGVRACGGLAYPPLRAVHAQSAHPMTPTRQELTPALKTVRIDLKEGWGKGDLVDFPPPFLPAERYHTASLARPDQRCAGYWLQVMAGTRTRYPARLRILCSPATARRYGAE